MFKLGLKGSAGSQCVEIGGNGLPSKGVRGVTAGHGEEIEGSCKE